MINMEHVISNVQFKATQLEIWIQCAIVFISASKYGSRSAQFGLPTRENLCLLLDRVKFESLRCVSLELNTKHPLFFFSILIY